LSQQETSREKFIEAAERHKILANVCKKCGHKMLETVIFCEKCSASKFESVELEGTGSVVTYTIQAVAPEGFEDAGSYAWVVFKLEGSDVKASGFLPGVNTPSDLPIGSKVLVVGYNRQHGLLLQK